MYYQRAALVVRLWVCSAIKAKYRQTSRDTRLFGSTCAAALWTDSETQSHSFQREPWSTSHQYGATANVCSPVFTIKVNILCFVCAADASLWGDHLMLSPGGKPSIRVYRGWNIEIDISNFPVSEATRQDAAAAAAAVAAAAYGFPKKIFEPFIESVSFLSTRANFP